LNLPAGVDIEIKIYYILINGGNEQISVVKSVGF